MFSVFWAYIQKSGGRLTETFTRVSLMRLSDPSFERRCTNNKCIVLLCLAEIRFSTKHSKALSVDRFSYLLRCSYINFLPELPLSSCKGSPVF